MDRESSLTDVDANTLVTLHVTFNKSNSSVSGDVPVPQITMVELGLGRNGATMMSAERERVDGFGQPEEGLRQADAWYLWGPYVSERQWGTVREDYSADGDAWAYLPHDHARSRAYRWGEDAMAGFCDVEQRLCLGLVLWNGRDPILKERMFGLTGAEGNHGEDVKEYWWYLDAVPSHAWNRWRYHYPRPPSPMRTCWSATGGGAGSTPSTGCSTPACSTRTATGSWRSTTPRRTRPTCAWWSG